MKLSFREKAGYGAGDTASNFVWALMVNFILYFYTDIFGITAAAAGTLLLVARCTDGATDLLVGAVADRTRSRWGRFRPYLLWLAAPLALTFILAFTTPDFDQWGKLVWAWATYNLVMLVYTAINIPYGALSGVMTDDPLERTSLNSYRMAMAQIGGIIANAGFLPLVARLGAGDDQTGAQRTVMLYAAIAFVLFLVSFYSTRERIHPPPTQRSHLKREIKLLFANPHWLLLFAAGIINITFAVARGTAGIYYLKNHLRWEADRISLYFLAGGIAMILGAACTRFAVRAIGKKNSFLASLALVALLAIPFYWIRPDQTAAVFACQLAGMFFAGINATLFWALVADAADFGEWKFGVRTTGMVFSATTAAQKAGMGVGAAMAGWLLGHFGYSPNTEQTDRAIHGILLLNSIIPAAGLLTLCALFLRYGLTESLLETIRHDLHTRRARIPAETPPA